MYWFFWFITFGFELLDIYHVDYVVELLYVSIVLDVLDVLAFKSTSLENLRDSGLLSFDDVSERFRCYSSFSMV